MKYVLPFLLMITTAHAQIMPSPTNSFTDTLGANAHLTWSGSYANAGNVQKALTYLSAKHVRDSIPYVGWTLPIYASIANTGVRFDIISSGPNIDIQKDLTAVKALLAVSPGAVDAYEGPNEYNANDYSYSGQKSRNNPAWGRLIDGAIFSAMRADPALSGVRFVGATMANASSGDVATLGNVSSIVDAGSWHTYFGVGEQPWNNVSGSYRNAMLNAPGRAMYFTEIGCSTVLASSTTWGGCGDASTAPKLALNMLADAFYAGARRAYFYELMDNNVGPSNTDLEGNFGLFDGNANPKPAATALHNLQAILADHGAPTTLTAWNGTLSGLPSGAKQIALQDSSGSHYLLLWNEPTLWNGGVVQNGAQGVTVRFQAAQNIQVFDPLTGTGAVKAVNATSLDFSLEDHLIVLKAGTATGQAPTPPATPAPTPVLAPTNPTNPTNKVPSIAAPVKFFATQTLSGIVVQDSSAGNDPRWLNIWVNGGTVSANLNGASVGGSDTQDIYLHDTLAHINSVLTTLRFTASGGAADISIAYGKDGGGAQVTVHRLIAAN